MDKNKIKPLLIDVEKFQSIFPKNKRIGFTKLIKDAYQKYRGQSNGEDYFLNLGNYGVRTDVVPEDLSRINDLYPPCIAILDFMSNLKKTYRILDYGCGIGNLIVYLNKLGFDDVYGFDNWQQISRPIAKNFLSYFALENNLVDDFDLFKEKPSILVRSGVPFHSDYAKTLKECNFEYLVEDSGWHVTDYRKNDVYCDADLEYLEQNYDYVGTYHKLAIIYKRKSK